MALLTTHIHLLQFFFRTNKASTTQGLKDSRTSPFDQFFKLPLNLHGLFWVHPISWLIWKDWTRN